MIWELQENKALLERGKRHVTYIAVKTLVPFVGAMEIRHNGDMLYSRNISMCRCFSYCESHASKPPAETIFYWLTVRVQATLMCLALLPRVIRYILRVTFYACFQFGEQLPWF